MFDREMTITRPHETFGQNKTRAPSLAASSKLPDGLRVLVVDDDFAIKTLVTAMLEVHNCLVDRAENGARALDYLATKRYDLVLTDLYMPVMDGYRLAREIRAQWPETKVAIMTGSNQGDVQAETAACKVDAWLAKPFGLEEIRRLLKRF
jgi:two-component system capsular synthesis sensor histidine kinase RcsC